MTNVHGGMSQSVDLLNVLQRIAGLLLLLKIRANVIRGERLLMVVERCESGSQLVCCLPGLGDEMPL